MTKTVPLLNPAQAARQLGISPKALRLYEQHGLLKPQRSEAGWRFYGESEMARAGQVAALRRLGMSLAEVGRALAGETSGVAALLERHQTRLGMEMAALGQRLEQVRQRRHELAAGTAPQGGGWLGMVAEAGPAVSLDLPWPWAGERFELALLPPVTWLTGPLGSGKTRLARALAAALPGAIFSGLDRHEANARDRLAAEPALSRDVESALSWLLDDGATRSEALISLLVLLCDRNIQALVFDLIEEGLDEATQDALGAWLRRYDHADRPIIAMTRSSAVLDLESVGAAGLVVYCPANHSPPLQVMPVPGAAGYEAVLSCLAPPEVRQRTAGMVAVIP